MKQSRSAPTVYGLGRLLRLLRGLRRPFVGHASGATFIEYLLLCGIVALGAIFAFKNLRDRSSRKVEAQAEAVLALTAPIPRPGSVLLSGPGGGGLLGPVTAGIAPPGRRSLPVIQPQCFAAGTPVLAEHGELAIDAIRVGERVWARDEATGDERLARVVQTFVTRDAPVIGVDVPFDVGRSERLFVTPDHPFWVHDRGWVAAQQLHGALLERRAPELLISTAPAARPAEPIASASETWAEPTSVYNLEVEGLHTYFVGRARVLVHNKCGLAVKTYDEWHGDPKLPANTEVNHLNQNAVYGTSYGGAIPRGAGASVPLTGSTHEPGTEHYKFHRSLENFWDLYRPGGPLENKLPTNAQYGAAVEQALVDAGFSKSDAQRIASGARVNRIAYGYKDNDKVPRVPGAFMGDDPDLQ